MNKKHFFAFFILIIFISVFLSIHNSQQRMVKATDHTNLSFSPFTGRPLASSINHKSVIVLVENSARSRPQKGLDKASIIYESLVEGGITRFLAVFWEEMPANIGPIRSVREYMLQIANPYQPLLLHSGASPEGFRMLSELQIESLDEIYNGQYYYRSQERNIPHNLFTRSIYRNYLNLLGSVEYEPRFEFQQVSIIRADAPRAEEILIDYWGIYDVIYKYDEKSNKYERYLFNLERPHLTEGGNHLSADNIIIQYVDTRVKDDVGRLDMQLTGSGEALIFNNGTIIKGSWQKDDKYNSFIKYYDQDKNPVRLKPGKTWVQIVPSNTNVEW